MKIVAVTVPNFIAILMWIALGIAMILVSLPYQTGHLVSDFPFAVAWLIVTNLLIVITPPPLIIPWVRSKAS